MPSTLYAILLALHTIAAVIWVGGMFFAYMAARPALAGLLEPPVRLPVWEKIFARFFAWVWVSIVVLLASGLWIIFGHYGGMKETPLYVHLMLGSGSLMMALFVFLFFVPYQGMRQALAIQDIPTAAARLAAIRRIIDTNLILGLITIVIGTAGRYW